MATRLDRLFVLLDQGSSQVTRKAAAAELGEVQRLHPHELNNLLSKVRQFLQSSSWDTRLAAGQAVEAIVRNVSDWFPSGVTGTQTECASAADSGRMTFALFDIDSIIDHGKDLLASEGNEFDDRSVSNEGEAGKERVKEQRRLLNSRLGLGSNTGICGITSEELVSNEDLVRQPQQRDDSSKKRQVSELTKPLSKKVKREDSISCEAADKVIDLTSVEDWPLEWFADELMSDLFSPSWETRHGAATGLREIVKLQGRCGGRVATAPTEQMDALNQGELLRCHHMLVAQIYLTAWLEDVALRLLCVLALDKFGDFVSDQVVAPVRETCAQTLGSVFHIMSDQNVRKCVDTVIQLLRRPEWEARHGGLLAMKYLLSVRQDMIDELLPLVFDSIFARLKDPIDDVSAVAAAALVPVKDALIKTLPHAIAPTLKFLWDALLEIDDLTSSTSSILMLLSSLLTFGTACSNGTSLDGLLPRLWPFLGHAMTAVRKSVLEALLILIKMSPNVDWMQEESFRTALSLIYQRSLIENDAKVSQLLHDAWLEIMNRSSPALLFGLSSNFIAGCICLMMHPAKFPFDSHTSTVWVTVKHHKHSAGHADDGETYEEKVFIGGYDLSENPVIREKAVLNCRIAAARLLAVLSDHLTSSTEAATPSPIECLSNLFLFHLNSKSSLQRMCTGLILQEWAWYRQKRGRDLEPMPRLALERCVTALEETIAYDEISSSFARLQQEVRDFLSMLQSNNITVSEKMRSGSILSFDQINELVTVEFPNACLNCDVKLNSSVKDALNEKSKSLAKSLAETMKLQSSLLTVTSTVLASAVVAWNCIPAKLNPLIRPLMDCIRKEENESIQDLAATHLSRLLGCCPAPAPKVVKNLVTFACSDAVKTPVVGAPLPTQRLARSVSQTSSPSTPSTPLTPDSSSRSIIMLTNLQKSSEKNGFRRSVSLVGKKNAPSESQSSDVLPEDCIESSREVQITTRGASAALTQIVRFFGESLPQRIPNLWNYFTADVRGRQIGGVEDAQVVVQALQVIEITAKFLDASLKSHLCDLLPSLCLFAESSFPEVRHLTARCLAALSLIITSETMNCVVDKLLPLLSSPNNEAARQGAVECIACVIESLGLKVVPYIVLLIVPMLARMSDQCEHVRLLATHCFAQLIQLMPLDNESRSETLERKDLLLRKQEERKFLEQLIDPKKLEKFMLPMPVQADLRSYQQQGVNWLEFLNRYKLHGILCDEMGLGKTLMSICILASDHYNKKASGSKALPSLVVCPPTLTGHWAFEVNKFVSRKHLSPLHYTGSPAERNKLKDKLKKQSARCDPDAGQNLVIASYDIVRNDIDFFSAITWNYCILDEGHIIKNGKTKLSKAIKTLHANHRLILTGTPIQNNVLELWSLFDFLMPGFLGTEKQFIARFSRPILQSRDAKSSSKEQEAGVLAMDALHRQVLPFILRRMKEDVLKDLPPKIMQDYYCDLSPLQARLYEDFAKSRVKQNMAKDLSGIAVETETKTEPKVASHIFQALQYLRKVCNHPKLVLTPQHPEFASITSQLQQQDSSLSDVNHATKLCALKQLLLDCGIGTQNMSSSGNLTVVNQHRALIFCQLKSMLDIVEQDLLKAHMPSVSYLRLDGSILPASRHSVVHRFNNDPSIDVLLLTTQVGGLGLNLTGADTVIFVEHDWNPMKDLQAMDRAHRIGQKKVVNVYRLVTTGTLEEKIMSLQKFKLTIANTVISQENASLQTMATDQLLDLFTLESGHASNIVNSDNKSGSSSRGVKSILESLPDLWEESAYESEYDLSTFIQSLR